MSIKERQLVELLDITMQQNFKEGIIPSLEVVLSSLGNYISQFRPGLPTMQLEFVKPFSTNDPSKIDKNLDRILFDLGILYEELIDNTIEILFSTEQIENTKDRSLVKLRKIKTHLLQLINMRATNNLEFSIHESFDSLDHWKPGEDDSADIEVGFGVMLPVNNMQSRKIDLSFIEDTDNLFSLEDTSLKINTVQGTKLSNIFTDILTSWRGLVTTTQKGPIVGNLRIPLKKDNGVEKVSRVEVDLHLISPVTLELFYKNANSELVKLGEYTTRDRAIFIIQDPASNVILETSELLLRMTKTSYDYDRMNSLNKTEYGFIFGIRNITVMEAYYYPTAILRTDPVNRLNLSQFANSVFDIINIKTDTYIPPDTNLEIHGTIFNSDDDTPSLNLLPINQNIDCGSTEIVDLIIPSGSWNAETTIFGSLYHSCTLASIVDEIADASGIIESTIQLYRGVDNWAVIHNVDTIYNTVLDVLVSNNPDPGDITVSGYYLDFLPIGSDRTLVPGTVAVSLQPGDSDSVSYMNVTTDYDISDTNRLFVIKGGRIHGVTSNSLEIPPSSLYVDYQYTTQSKPSMEPEYIYSTNVLLQKGTTISVNTTVLDTANYEFIKIEIGNEVINFTKNTTSKIEVPSGWFKIIVGLNSAPNDAMYIISKDPMNPSEPCLFDYEYDSTNQSNPFMINVNNVSNSTRMYAYKTPLYPINIGALKYGTRIFDRIYCSLDSGKIWINFQPGSPILIGDSIDNRDILFTEEKFQLIYNRIREEKDAIDLELRLSRSPAKPYLTPILRSLTITGSYRDR